MTATPSARADTSLVKIKRNRHDKQEDTRRAIFTAAIEVVGEQGYAGASVAKIAARAKIASGTFYNYFPTQQDLFDQLLPVLGERLLAHIRAQISDTSVGVKREQERISAYFDFCRKTPGFLRILNEAEVFAPRAYHQHFRHFYEGYRRALLKGLKNGEIQGYSPDELDVLVFMLMGMRSYLSTMIQSNYIDTGKFTMDRLIGVYSKLLCGGVFIK
ncbi:TetR/AcrR family transcriptional regulator [Pusillimonas sp. SM2304]|uniref:TetR/AcrR family transcriptional regulator n=1 Tax=Pusillimonas sp. SM2304 TaxID=3073241 RepID=UPI0028750757|nr:TetR/AcrR family transcriptional regulator [Pusillimonas sp. SM2304]MDS1140417.1 TetR/AcrR family transcriptional regulator [Pusillimonas sp. SM2304]